ncbi:hypothetical protein [Actinomadura livida]|uniref:Uncharacterized protein n=1 Tax=Actinomadura livida TaxID=79909 RepID=A0A7W7I730_9ACTN|nr:MULTISPECIES: hypothetical protein [Actinomadura]MBB4771745.1 hypothetical protein [Actinomadura catellatispora]GGU02253.1 hypothetical protein GCM10010208_27670 [Actinomadura livida]
MESVLQLVAKRQADLDRHPLFEWMNSGDRAIPDPLLIMPPMATFSMGFRDVNKWVFRYPEAADDLQRGINVHTFEDQTHSRLFLEDWKRLGLNEWLGWTASDTLWWLFRAETNEVAREHGVYFLSMAVADREDPLLRFAQSEMMEALGAVFFKHASKIAIRFTEQTGVELPYMGPFHVALETGHMDCEDLFVEQRLDERKRTRALDLADTIYRIFTAQLDMWLDYAQKYIDTGNAPRPPARPMIDRSAGGGPGPRLVADGPVHPSQEPLQKLLTARRKRSEAHPFYSWLENRGDRVTALQALQRFIPMWTMDIMGYRDLNRYAMRYAEPVTDLHHAVNSWADDLTTHNTLFFNDWKQLGLDEILGWNSSDTLEFCYLDPQTDVHRRNIVKFTELAVAHDDPVLRLWLMNALETSGEPFFRRTKALADEAEAVTGVRLDYLGDRHEIAHHAPVDAAAPAVHFKDRPLTPAAREVAAHMIETVFDAGDEQLEISLDVALSNKFGIA